MTMLHITVLNTYIEYSINFICNCHFYSLDILLAFEKYRINENCPIGRIVLTVDECKAASAVLGLSYKGIFNLFTRPAGCYFTELGYPEHSYFNRIVDPSKTNPEYFDNTGGVCVKGKF